MSAADADGLIAGFVEGAREIVEHLGQQLVELERAPRDAALLEALFRGFHTIKGSAGFLDLGPLVEACHAAEDALDGSRAGRRTPETVLFDALHATLVGMEAMLAALAGGRALAPLPPPLLSALRTWASEGPEPADAVSEEPRLPDDELEALLDALHRPGARVPGAAPVPQSGIRVEAGRLDGLLDLVEELMQARHRLRDVSDSCQDSALERAVDRVDAVARRLQDEVLRIRMQPLARAFARFPKLARDAARALGKEVEVELQDTGAEIDRRLVDALADPLVHLVRNAIDHGIEAPGVRIAAGKPRRGRIRLTARHAHGRLLVEIDDDGAGMDPDVLRAKAAEEGFIDAAAAAALDDHDAFRMIFIAGFSTRSAVTEVSGRGVGMDVVARCVEDLGGEIRIDSVRGTGTRFVVDLPLALASMPALLFSACDRLFALPLSSVRGVRDPRCGHPPTDHDACVAATTCLDLRSWLGDPIPAAGPVLSFDTVSGPASLAVDSVGRDEPLLVRPLPAALGRLPGHAGAALARDGRIALLLDAEHLRSCI